MKWLYKVLFAFFLLFLCLTLFGIRANAATVCVIGNGCTGTSTPPALGQLLIGGKNGEYEFVASSTLGGGSSAFSTSSASYWLTQQTTGNLAEGSNLYYTLSRWANAFAGTTTDALAEGVNNLYFTSARAITALTGQNISIFANNVGYLTAATFDTDFDNRLSATTSLPNITTLSGLSLPYSQLTGTPNLSQYLSISSWFATTSAPQLTTLANLSLPYSQVTGTPNLSTYFKLSDWYGTSTDGLKEGTTNLYFTNARADARFVADLAATTSVKSITTLPSLSLPYSQITGTPTIASSTLLGDNNTFSGANTFSQTISASINGNANTATALAANGTNCSAGYFALGVDASGNAEGCTYAFSTTTPYSTGFLVINASGKGYTVASSSLDLPNGALQNSAITINGTAFNLGDSHTITAASSTLLGDTDLFSGHNTFSASTTIAAQLNLQSASSTLFSAANLWDFALTSGNCVQAGAGGLLTTTGSACGSGSGGVTNLAATYPLLTTGSTGSITISTALSSSTLTASSPLTGSFAQVGSGGSLGIQQGNGSQNGYISSTDWTTFNNKISSTSLSASYPLSYNSSTGAFSTVATSSLNLTTSSFASANISQWTNNSGYLTSETDPLSLHLTSWYATTTDGLHEGTTNLYFTNARSDARFVADLAATTSVKSITTLPSLSLPYSQLTGTPTIASSTLLGDNNTFSGINSFTNSSSNFGGTWQTYSPSHFFDFASWYATTSAPQLTTLSNLATVGTITSGSWHGTAIADSYISSSGNWNTAYTDRIASANYPLSISSNALSIVATSSENCTVSCFASANISQWTNNAGYLTSSGIESTSTNPFMATYFVATSTSQASSFLYASTTALSATNLFASSLTSGDCVQASTGGLLTTTGSACGSGSGGSASWPFTPSTYAGVASQSTTTPFWLNGTQLIASSTLAVHATSTDQYIGNDYQETWASAPDYFDIQNVGSANPYTEGRLLSNNAVPANGAESTWSMVVDCSGQDLFNNQNYFDHTIDDYPTAYQAELTVAAAGTCPGIPLVIQDRGPGANVNASDNVEIFPSGTTGFVNAATSSVNLNSRVYIASSTAAQILEVDSTPGTATTLGTPILTVTGSSNTDGGGDVGVGTATPGAKLEVDGNIFLNSAGTGLLELSRGATSNYGGVQYQTNATNEWTLGLRPSDNTFHFFNESLAADAATINQSSNLWTFTNSTTTLATMTTGWATNFYPTYASSTAITVPAIYSSATSTIRATNGIDMGNGSHGIRIYPGSSTTTIDFY